MKNTWKISAPLLVAIWLLLSLQAFQQKTSVEVSVSIAADTSLARTHLLQKDSLYKEKDYPGAITHLQAAAALYRQQADWEAVVDCYVEMSVIADNIDLATREGYIEEAITLAKVHLPPEHRLLALAYRQKGESFINQQVNDSSLYYLNRALPILEKEKDWNNWTMCRLMVGINYYFLKEYEAMDSAFVLVQAHLDDPAVAVSTRSNVSEWLGIQARINGDYDAGIRYFLQVIELETSVADIDSLNLFGQYYQLGNFYYYKGDYRRALEYYAVARNIYLALGEEDDNLSLAYFQIGSINTRLQNYPEAIRNLQQSLAVSERIEAPYPEDIINAKNVLGKCYIELEQFDSAFFYLQGALAVPHTFGKATTNGRIGICYKATGQIDTAIVYLKKALELYGNSKNGMNALWNMHLADCYSKKGDYPTAFSYHQKALAASGPAFEDSLDIHANPALEHAQFPIYLLQALHAKAQTLAAYTADPQALQTAFQTYQLAAVLIDSLKADYVLESSQLTWGKTFKQIYAEGIDVARRLYEQSAQPDYLNAAFVFMEKSKSSLLLDALRSAEGKTLGAVPDSLSRREKELVLDMAYYEKKLAQAQEEEAAEQALLFEGYLSETRLALADLKEQLQRDYPAYHQLKFEQQEPSIETVRASLLDEETAFIQYFMYGQQAIVLFVSGKEQQLLQIGEADTLRARADAFRSVLADVRLYQEQPQPAFERYNTLSFDLYRQLLAELPAHAYKKWIIAPDGILNLIPFEALTRSRVDSGAEADFGKLDYLLHLHEIQYAYSAGLLLKNKERQDLLAGGKKCLAMAPTYQNAAPISMRGSLQDVRSGAISNLEGTGREVQAIAEHFGGEFVLSAAATEAAFKEKAPDFNVLHLAMHGEADFENPNFGNLIFTDLNNPKEEDHRLYHYEIATMQLQAQLVVLSACETGVGKYEAGEGVFSLARSFMYAGVPSVAMSLWKVNDQSTSQLMARFYQELAAGKPKGTALQDSKAAYLEASRIRYRHPYYWAGFVLLGDSRPLKAANPLKGLWLSAALGLLLLAGIFIWLRKKQR